jgi:hypothetical protein
LAGAGDLPPLRGESADANRQAKGAGQPEVSSADNASLAAPIPRALVAGFVATAALTSVLVPAYWVALSVGSASPGATTFLRWLWALAHNPLTDTTKSALPLAVGLHFLMGFVWAVAYSALAEPRLSGPGWRRGMVFSLIPWSLSVVVFFPAVGAGMLGFNLGAGPLPVIGNLILHLVYGAVLGWLYSPAGERFQTESGQAESSADLDLAAAEQRWIAIGIVFGVVFGGFAGWLGSVLVAGNPGLMIVLGAITGSMVGAFTGSFRAMAG